VQGSTFLPGRLFSLCMIIYLSSAPAHDSSFWKSRVIFVVADEVDMARSECHWRRCLCIHQKSKFWQLCDNDWSLCTDLDDCQIIQAEIRVIVLVWNNADDLISTLVRLGAGDERQLSYNNWNLRRWQTVGYWQIFIRELIVIFRFSFYFWTHVTVVTINRWL
jgi:hypothetical protein